MHEERQRRIEEFNNTLNFSNVMFDVPVSRLNLP